MPRKKMNRAQRAKAVVGALGGGKKAQKAVAKTGKAIRAGVKGDKKKAARAAGDKNNISCEVEVSFARHPLSP